MTQLATTRLSIFPLGNDTWESIAKREMSSVAVEDAISMLQSWNLHVFMRPAADPDTARAGNQILPSDIIFIEAPLA